MLPVLRKADGIIICKVSDHTKEVCMRFDNRVALVTGAASGIGRALVQQFVAEGAAVVAVDIVEEAVHRLVAELQSQGGKATGCVANISSDEDVERMLGIATSIYGRLDILCNNAGIMDLMTPAADVPLALWDRVLAVNLTGPFLACRRAMPLMPQQGGGKHCQHGFGGGSAWRSRGHPVYGLQARRRWVDEEYRLSLWGPGHSL